jgi:hypothetical protein
MDDVDFSGKKFRLTGKNGGFSGENLDYSVKFLMFTGNLGIKTYRNPFFISCQCNPLLH